MSTLIFDFDGTIADTLFITVGVFRKLARKGQVTDDEEVEVLRGLSARAALKRVGVRWWQVPLILQYGRWSMRRQIDEAQVFPGMKAALGALHERGHTLLILSTNKTSNVTRFLQKNGLDHYFQHIYADIGLFAKARWLRRILRMRHLKLQNCYYIGDEVRDYEAAHHVGMHCVSVAWGYNNERALTAAGVERLVRTPKELLAVFPK